MLILRVLPDFKYVSKQTWNGLEVNPFILKSL